MPFTDLPYHIIKQIAHQLEPTDLISFSECTHLNESFWKSKCQSDFGDMHKVYDIFVNATRLVLPNDLSAKFSCHPDNWRQYYITKVTARSNVDDALVGDQGNRCYEGALKSLCSLQDDLNYSMIVHVASKMLWLLEVSPEQAGAYYILSLILYILKKYKDALAILNVGRRANPSFKPFGALEEKISQHHKHDSMPMTVNDHLSPELFSILLEIFYKFDKDNDGCLNNQELSSFVFATNGEYPPASFLEQMGERFGSNEQGFLTKEGFLTFYLEQTLNDSSETIKDISMHGYDWSQLSSCKQPTTFSFSEIYTATYKSISV